MNTKILKSVCGICLVCGALTSCDDQIMEWKTPEGHGSLTAAEIPLQVKEVLANYGTLKEYSAQYMPGSTLGVGAGITLTTNDEDARQAIIFDNFQMVTFGNAMKMDAMVTNSGALNTPNSTLHSTSSRRKT